MTCQQYDSTTMPAIANALAVTLSKADPDHDASV
jgi:hypothetical protein